MWNVLSSALPCQWGLGKVWRIVGRGLGVFGEVAEVGVGHSAAQEASGGVISQASEPLLAESITSLDLTTRQYWSPGPMHS